MKRGGRPLKILRDHVLPVNVDRVNSDLVRARLRRWLAPQLPSPESASHLRDLGCHGGSLESVAGGGHGAECRDGGRAQAGFWGAARSRSVGTEKSPARVNVRDAARAG